MEEKGLSSIIVVVIVVAVVAAVVGVGSYFLLKPSTRENEPKIEVAENIGDVDLKAISITREKNLISIDFGFSVFDEVQAVETAVNHFTVRNVGNVAVNVLIRASDASSYPGEPVTNWILSDTGSIGIDIYAMRCTPSQQILGKTDQLLVNDLPPGGEYNFGLKVQAPSVITTPARMWTRVVLTALQGKTKPRIEASQP